MKKILPLFLALFLLTPACYAKNAVAYGHHNAPPNNHLKPNATISAPINRPHYNQPAPHMSANRKPISHNPAPKNITYRQHNGGYVFYDNFGARQAFLKHDPINKRIMHFDRYGHNIGYYERHRSGQIIYYDSFGRIIRRYNGIPSLFNIYLSDIFPISIFI